MTIPTPQADTSSADLSHTNAARADLSQEIRQQLSALVDGELERDQTRFLIRRVADDAELGACWQRWHVTGECLRGSAPLSMRGDFVARVSLAIADEAIPRRGMAGDVLKWAGGFAVAASVALVALLAMRPDDGTIPGQPGAAPLVASVPAGGAEVAPSPYRETDLRPPLLDAQTVSADPDNPFASAVRIDPRIEGYLVRHNEATAAQGQGFVSYVTLVAPARERNSAARSTR